MEHLPKDLQEKLISQLGINPLELKEALSSAESGKVGVTPFLRLSRRACQELEEIPHIHQHFQRENRDINSLVSAVTLEIRERGLFRDLEKILKRKKCDKEEGLGNSERLRALGNEAYKRKEYKEALKLYNESMSATETAEVSVTEDGTLVWSATESLAKALANRSAIHFQKGDYDFCLEDIKTSFQFGYPENLRQKLRERRMKAKEAKTKASGAFENLQKGQGSVTKGRYKGQDNNAFDAETKTTPFCSQSLEFCSDSNKGRFTKAVKAIKAGTLLLSDNPLVSVLIGKQKNCHFCSRKVDSRRQLPSPLTPDSLLFCDLACLNEAVVSFHLRESRLDLRAPFVFKENDQDRPHFDEISGSVLLTTRTLLCHDLKDWTESKNVVVDDCEFFEKNPLKMSAAEKMMLFNSMVRHSSERSWEECLCLAVKVAFVLTLLEVAGFFFGGREKWENEVGSFVWVIMEAMQYNMHPIDQVLAFTLLGAPLLIET